MVNATQVYSAHVLLTSEEVDFLTEIAAALDEIGASEQADAISTICLRFHETIESRYSS